MHSLQHLFWCCSHGNSVALAHFGSIARSVSVMAWKVLWLPQSNLAWLSASRHRGPSTVFDAAEFAVRVVWAALDSLMRGGIAVARSVLIVAADPEQRARIIRILNEADGWNVVEAAESEQAMRIATTASPSVAVLTVAPGYDKPALNLVDRLTTEHGIPVVLLTSEAGAPPQVMAAHEGVMGVLIEPPTSGALRGCLEVAIHRSQEVHALRRETESLRRSIEDRKTIERAKGLLMERAAVTEREAYARIRQKSMDSQRPMVEIARAIILAFEMNGGTASPLLKR